MAARLSALRAGRFSPPGIFLVLIFVTGCVDPRAIVWLEGFGKLKKSTSSGTRTGDLPACSVVPQPLRYHVPYFGVALLIFIVAIVIYILFYMMVTGHC
jgi:hypothetical protein